MKQRRYIPVLLLCAALLMSFAGCRVEELKETETRKDAAATKEPEVKPEPDLEGSEPVPSDTDTHHEKQSTVVPKDETLPSDDEAPHETTESTKEAETPENVTAKPTAADGYCHSYPLGTIVSYDLNGDGTGEEISVTVQGYDCEIIVNGIRTEYTWGLEWPTGYYSIVNVDESNDQLLISVSDYGPSDDSMTYLCAYTGSEIIYVGQFDDLLGENVENYPTATCNGDGTISATTRMDLLGTWFANAQYAVYRNTLVDITKFYSASFEWEATTLCDILMYTNPQTTESPTVIPAGTVLTMTGCVYPGGNTCWVAFESDGFGQTMWICTGPYPCYIETPHGTVESSEVFDGYAFVD